MITTIYLAGPIQGCDDLECKVWRSQVKKLWDGVCLDPMRRNYPDSTLSDKECEEVIKTDLEDIRQSDALVANITRISVGTSMEVMFAAMQKKPVFLIYTGQIPSLSPWLRHHATEIFATVGDCIAWLEHLNRPR